MFNFFPIPTIRIDEIFTAFGNGHGWNSGWNWIDNISRKFTKWAFEILPRNVCFTGTRISRSYSNYRRTVPFFIEQERERTRKPDLKILGVTKQTGNDEVTLRLIIFNQGKSTAKDCYGLMTLEFSKDSVVEIAGYPTLVTQNDFTTIDGAELCWWREGNPPQVNIPISVKQDLEIVKLVKNTTDGATLVFPSDQGWGSGHHERIGGSVRLSTYIPDKFARISLKAKSYTGSLFIGADDVEPVKRNFTIVYDEKTQNIFLELSGFP